jgi:hypothetical protein
MKKRKIEIIFDDNRGVITKSNVPVSSAEIMQGILILLRNINRNFFGDFIGIIEKEKKQNG